MLNRIISILVVLATSVLIYPFVFNPHDHFSGHTDSIQVPPFPSSKTQSDTIKALSTREENDIKVAAKQKKVAVKKYSKLSFKNLAWVIQVGTYNDKVDALSVVNQLRAKGYNAFIHQTNAAFGKEVQVYIGPEIKKEAAASLAAKLAKETKLSGVVKTYKLLSV